MARHSFLILAHIRSLGRDVVPLSCHQMLETVAKLLQRRAIGVLSACGGGVRDAVSIGFGQLFNLGVQAGLLL